MPFQIALLYDKMLKGMPLNIISYKKAIWKGIEGHLKGIVQKLEDSRRVYYAPFPGGHLFAFCLKLIHEINNISSEFHTNIP